MTTKLKDLIRSQLRQGTAPDRLARAVAVGLLLGCFPVFGATTALCLAVGPLLGLNQPVLQAVNHLATPIQLALMIPLWRLGSALFRVPPAPLRPSQVKSLLQAGLGDLWGAYGAAMACGAVAWALLGIPASYLVYRAALPVISRIQSETSRKAGPQA